MENAAPKPRGFLAWYRRYYLLVNLPILLLVTELVVTRLDIANRPPFDRGNNLYHALKRYWESPPKSGEPVMVVLGNSVIMSGVDQSVVESALQGRHWRVYNFGLGGACVDDEGPLLELLSERGIKVDAVVMGLNLYGIIDRHRDVLREAQPRRSPYLHFHRSRLRTALSRAIKKRELEWKPFGQFTNVTQVSPEVLRNATRAMIKDFGGKQPDEFPMIARIKQLHAKLASRGIRLHVVLLPMNPVVTAQVPNYEGLMDGVRRELPPDSLDASHGFGSELFFDEGHLTDAGKNQLTSRVVSWLLPKEGR